MIILYDNLVNDASISSFSQNPNFTWSDAFNDNVLAHVGRSIGDSAEWIKFTFTSAVNATDIFIFNHNFEAGATVKLQGNATDIWTSPSVDETLTISDVIYKNFTGGSYKYWRIYMDHSASSDGYFQIGKVFLGVPYQIVDPDAGIDTPIIGQPRYSKSIGGQIFGQSTTFLQTFSLNLTSITQAEKDNYDTFITTVNLNNPFACILFESSISSQPPLYCNLAKIGSRKFNSNNGISWDISGITFEECR